MLNRLAIGLVLAAAAAVACSNSADDKPKRVRKPPGPPLVVSTVTLPMADGRIHIVDVPGRYETSRCLVHVSDAGHSSMSCLPQVEFQSIEYER